MRLQANENPYAALSFEQLPLPQACFNTYPEEGYPTLKVALSHLLKVPKDTIEVGNGSDELLDVIFRSCLKPGQRVATLSPSFSEYTRFFQINQLQAVTLPPDQALGFTSETKFLELLITEQPDAVILCNPNNPTGQFFKSEFIKEMLAVLPANTLVILDEAYIDFVVTNENSGRWFLEDHRVIQVRTLSKSFALAGLRIGYCLANPELLLKMAPYLAPYRINHPAYYYGCQTLALNPNAVEISSLLATKSTLRLELEALGYQVATSGEGNFLWLTTDNPDLRSALTTLPSVGILIRGFSSNTWSPEDNVSKDNVTKDTVSKDYWRITIGTPNQINNLLSTIKKGVPNVLNLKSV